jgi:hypothetical protein
MFQKTNDPPLIQAFKHMGHTFRNGGFCVERSKVEKKQANVQTVQESAEVEETDVSDVSSPTSADGNAMEVRFNDLGTSEEVIYFNLFCTTLKLYTCFESILINVCLFILTIQLQSVAIVTIQLKSAVIVTILNSGTINC